MIIVPLGVASATPTAKRHLSSVALWRDGRVFLFDCGENAQMRALQAGIKRSKIDYVFISHLDGDHFFGLPGLISTMQLQRRENDLHIIGPAGLKDFVEAALRVANIELSFDIHFTEIEDGFEHQVVLDDPDYYVECRPLEHKTLCIGYRFQEKDKPGKVNAERAQELGITEDVQYKELKAGNDVTLEDGTVVKSEEIVGPPKKGHSFAYVTDTLFSVNALKLAYKATILYHEATFDQSLRDKAEETYHSTAEDAATIALKAEVERLVITHFSARYTNQFVLLKEARKTFKDTWVATELRPIMTDPEHERGIIKAKVPIERIGDDSRGKQRGRHSKGRYNQRGSNQGRGRSKYFRSRKQYDDRRGGGGGRYDNRDDRRGGGSRRYDNRDDRRGGGGGRYDNRDDRRGGGGGRYDDRRDDRRGGGGRYDNRDDRRGGGDRYDNRRDDDRGGRRHGGGSGYRRDYDNRPKDRDSDQSDLPVKPRAPFDDFDRF